MVALGQMGGIRGSVIDQDFEVPLPGVKVVVTETGQETTTGDAGSFYLEQVQPGAYTLVFSKPGYTRALKPNVVVSAGKLAEVEAWVAGEYEEMDELVVRDIQLGGASEIGLLNLRMESSALMDSVGADMIGRAGASDAAGALKLVSGTTVQDGKYAVVRGLPDRYVVSTLNGVRLPTADPDKRAVQLDQYPSSLIESVRVLKTFTPEQQGDASGGTVDVVLRGIPQERVLKFSVGTKYNENYGGDEFLSYDTSEMDYLGERDFDSPPDLGPQEDPDPQYIPGSYGTRPTDQPVNYSWGVELGDRWGFDAFGEDVSVGAIATFNYDHKASHTDGMISEKYYIDELAAEYLGLGPGKLAPYIKGTVEKDRDTGNVSIVDGDLSTTELWNLTKSTHEINWSGALGVGLEHDLLKLNYLHVFTHNAEDTAVRATDTRGRATYNPKFIDVNDGSDQAENIAPYLISETLLYKERDTSSDQLGGELEIPLPDIGFEDLFALKQPVLDFKWSKNSSSLAEPNKRINEHYWLPGQVQKADDPTYDWRIGLDPDDEQTWFNPSAAWLNPWTNSVSGEVAAPPELSDTFYTDWAWLVDAGVVSELPERGWAHDTLNPATQSAGGQVPGVVTNQLPGKYRGLAGEQLGSFQQIWKKVVEDSDQFAFNYNWDFDNWTSKEGFFKVGVFQDHVDRDYFIQTLSNKNKEVTPAKVVFDGEWTDDVGDLFVAAPPRSHNKLPDPIPNSTVFSSKLDVGYDGVQELDAWYYMAKFPVFDFLSVQGGVRHEEFTIQTFLKPDDDAVTRIVKENGAPGEINRIDPADPSKGYEEDADYSRVDDLPSLGFDITPLEQITFRANWAQTVARQQFKELVPIIQREYAGAPAFVGNPDLRSSPVDNLDFRLDYNPYPGGLVSGSVFFKDIADPIEYYQGADGAGNLYTFTTNYNSATVQGWEFEIRQDLGRFADFLEGMSVGGNYTSINGELDVGNGVTRDVMQMPEYLYNLFWTYDLGYKGIRLGLFYNHQGEKLVVNKPEISKFPAIYALPYGTLNFSVSAKLTENLALSLKAKNLTDPEIQTAYREEGYEQQLHSSYKKGREYSIGMSYQF